MTGDLFGHDPPQRQAGGEVQLAMVLHGETAAAWLLAETMDRREARWVPKSECRRGEGRDENIWTLPTWMARDRGWV
jgi:hypothetical protein